MYVPEIIEIKNILESLKNEGVIAQWELPYETLLTRRSAAIFFVTPAGVAHKSMEIISQRLSTYEHFHCRANEEMNLSKLMLRITFNKEEMEKSKMIVG